MIRSLLIANRSEIACRIIRTARVLIPRLHSRVMPLSFA